NVAHTANTDHRVLRRIGDNPPWVNPPPRLASGIPLLLFHGDRARQQDPELQRDLGIALVRLVENGSIGKNIHVEDTALPLLERSLAPDDLAGWRAKGYALWLQGRQEEAKRIFATIVAQQARDEETLALLAQLCAEMK